MRFAPRPDRPGSGASIRARMALAMLAAAALTIPVVLLSLLYLRRMNAAVGRIVNEDIELMHVADRVTLEFAGARRDEKNFLLYRDSIYLRQNHAALERIVQLADTGRRLDPSFASGFDRVLAGVAAYRALVDSLVGLPQGEPPERLLLPDLQTLRRHHESLLRAAAESPAPAERDSLIAAAARLAPDIIWPAGGGRSLNDSIVSLQAAIENETEAISGRARDRVRGNRDRARTLAAWGQRNIISALLLVLVVLVWLVVTLPRRAVTPIKRILNALQRVENGDLDVRVKVSTRDEIGELARGLNRALARLSDFDNRKKNRILHLEKRFRLLINDIAEAVIVVDRVPSVLLANGAAEELLGCSAGEAVGRKLSSFENLAFFEEELERVLAGSTSRQSCEIMPELPGSAICIEALRDQAGNVTGALIVITDPRPPEKEEGPRVGNQGQGTGTEKPEDEK
ncbi:HAMP domain-containing protein [candidate division WOR-3 bacterium]|nr:HAMP domain-containing protein [candidate division WOR-3 bacterium]